MQKTTYFFLFLSMLGTLFISVSSCKQGSATVEQKFELLSLFSDHMVLQQNEKVAIWGKAPANQKIKISTTWGQEESTTVAADGKWKLNLETGAAGGPYQLTISAPDSTVILNNVMLGEVWLASGQSNMEMPLTGYLPTEPIDNNEEEIANAQYPKIRMFTVQRNESPVPIDTVTGEWAVCNPEHASKFSATAYFFARKLHKELDVPVGIIHSSWGGTEAEAWASKKGLKEFPDFIEEIESFTQVNTDDWSKQFDSKKAPTNINELNATELGDGEFSSIEYDDSAWKEIKLPSPGCTAELFIPDVEYKQNLHGIFWYRKVFELEYTTGDFTIKTGAIDDADQIYVNGHLLGATWAWNEERSYQVPNTYLNPGVNVIAIRHYDFGGGSNVNGPIVLESSVSGKKSLEGKWSALFHADLIKNDLVIYGVEQQGNLSKRPYVSAKGPNALAACLYNGMINPIIPYTIKGAIWYQGESNIGRAEQYKKLFPAMITDWRARWETDFPFYYAQIAPYEYNNNLSPALRDAQRKTLSLTKTGMAILTDIGHATHIHPGNKQDVGKRLARLALKNDYGKDIIASGPLFKSYRKNGDYIYLDFDSVGDGLASSNNPIPHFEISLDGKNFKPAKASIEGKQIKLFTPGAGKLPVIRYAWKDYLEASVFNSAGLPMSSFTTAN